MEPGEPLVVPQEPVVRDPQQVMQEMATLSVLDPLVLVVLLLQPVFLLLLPG